MSDITVHPALIQNLLQPARSQGVDLPGLCRALSLDVAALAPENKQRLSLADFNSLLTGVWATLGDESAGFSSRPLKPGMFALMCQATITCPNLRRVLLRGASFMTVVSDDIHFSLKEQGEEAYLHLQFDNTRSFDDTYFILCLLLIWMRWACWMVGKNILLERAHFSFPSPSYEEDLYAMFPCRHQFDQSDNVVVFHRRYLSMPVVQDPQSLGRFLADAPQCLLTRYRADDSVSGALKELLQEQGFTLTLEEVSALMCLSGPTLRRRLREEGNSFQGIKDSVRKELSIYLLKDPSLSLDDVAVRTGFSEASAFTRAFKRWFGVSPRSY